MRYQLTLIFLILSFLPGSATEPVYNPKDILVFENILKTVLDLEPTDTRFGLSERGDSVKVTYLKKQGLLIEIDPYTTERGGLHAPFPIGKPHFPRRFTLSFDDQGEEKSIREIQRAREEMEREAEILKNKQLWLEKEREYLQGDLKEEVQQMQELKEEKMEKLEEELHRLEEKARKKEISEAKIKEEIRKSMKEQQEAMKYYREQLATYRDQHVARVKQNMDTMLKTIIDSLCQYGATIRCVQPGEYFTFILKNVVSAKDGVRKNAIYIFTRQAVIDCRDGKLTQEDVLAEAEHYLSD
jgi:hypothetical protein